MATAGQLELLSVAQMRRADAAAMAAGVGFDTLMENAGSAVAAEIMRRWPLRPALVLCGPGNNGGDGLVIARTLRAAGWPVRVALAVPRECLGAALEPQARQWPGGFEALDAAAIGGAELVVDALFGAGLNRALSGIPAAVLQAVAARQLPVVAVDVPSGLDGDTGQSGGAVAAVLTVTFFRRKPGHLLAEGPELCGELVVADIGIPPEVLRQVGVDTWENAPPLWSGALSLPAHGPASQASTNQWCVLPGRNGDAPVDALAHARAVSRRTGKVVAINGARAVLAEPGGCAVVHPIRMPAWSDACLHAALAGAMDGEARVSAGIATWQRLAQALWSAVGLS